MQDLGLVLRRGEIREPLDRALAVGDDLGHASPDRLDGKVAPVGQVEIDKRAINCRFMNA